MHYQLLSAVERDAIIKAQLCEHLPPLGLVEREPRSWIDGSQPPARRLFEILLLKAAAMRIRWGFSLDFVPHISAGRVRWHRTDRTALLDVYIDPKDLPDLSFLNGPERLTESLKALLPEATARARESWRKGATFQGMLGIIQEVRDKRTNYWWYENTTQLPLAYAFLHAKTGNLRVAEDELESEIIRRQLDDDEAAKLKQLAKEYAAQHVH